MQPIHSQPVPANTDVTRINDGTETASAEISDAQVISSDFETFLLMLTTQLENQDPLNPIESQDFAVQLATFSGVEQQVQTNDLLKELSHTLGTSDLAQMASWIGANAKVQAPILLDGSPVEISIEPDPGSEQAELIVLDASNREVTREVVPSTSGSYAWVGTNAAGEPLPVGVYNLHLSSSNGNEVTSTRAVPHYAQIYEARQGVNGLELVIAGNVIVPANSVTAVRGNSD